MFQLRIETDNAAFDGDATLELARILRALADTLSEFSLSDGGSVRDINGNRVGSWSLDPREES